MSPEKAEELACVLDEAISSMKFALEYLEGSGTRAEEQILIISEIIREMEQEREEYDTIVEEQRKRDLEDLNREYERPTMKSQPLRRG